MFDGVASMFLFTKRYHIVEMIKKIPLLIHSFSIAFHGDVDYVGSDSCAIQWNILTDAVVWLEEYPDFGLIAAFFCPT